jgi:hypothetical protein
VVRSDHDEGLVRISLPLKSINRIELGRFRIIYLILQWPKEEEGKEDTRKKIMLNYAYKSVERHSLSIYS